MIDDELDEHQIEERGPTPAVERDEASADDRNIPADESDAGTPRWVKVFAGVGIAIAILFAVVAKFGGHGPQMHG